MKSRYIVSILAMLLLALFVPSAQASSAEGGSPWDAWMLLWRVINTVALIALLGYFLKKPLVTFFTERKASIVRDLEQAKEQRDVAERIIEEYKEKMAGMEKELERMRAELKKSADAETEKVVAGAERMALAMVEAAKVSAEQELRKAKIALKNEAVEMAVQLAETLIREKINEQDRKRIAEDYLVKVGGMK
jgi:F-type H+-transporting ATPase subunit b